MNDYSFFENVRTLFTEVVNMMDSVNVPGIPVTFWDLTCGFFMTACAIKLLGIFMGIGIGGSMFGAASGISNTGRRIGSSINGGINENKRIKNSYSSYQSGSFGYYYDNGVRIPIGWDADAFFK